MAIVGVLTVLAFALRFYKINHPDQVVFVSLTYVYLLPPVSPLPHPSFDEVHFGKFAAYYILREYYFDVHPPFAKLLFGLAGWFVGFDGQFNFENIGDNYTENHVPYVGMRALPAILGSLTVPIVYGIMKESGYGTVIAAFSASIVLFGMYGYISAMIKLSVYFQTTRTLPSHASFYWTLHSSSSFLLLCTPTFASVSCDICMSKFPSHYPELCSPPCRPFTPEWWGWLIATGVFMACAWGSKVNGILTVVAIGIAVLVDLWDLLDIRKNPSMVSFVSLTRTS